MSKEKIETLFFEDSIEKKTKNPYLFSLKFMDIMANHGEIREDDNHMDISGIDEEIEIFFEVSKKISENTISKIFFEITGDQIKGDIKINSRYLVTNQNEKPTGFFTSVLSDYFKKEIFPKENKEAISWIKNVRNETKKYIK